MTRPALKRQCPLIERLLFPILWRIGITLEYVGRRS